MRPAIMTFITLFTIFVIICIFLAFVNIDEALHQSIYIGYQPNPGPVYFPVQVWSVDFWILLALVISELAPFVPGKAGGILHGIAEAVLSFFKRK